MTTLDTLDASTATATLHRSVPPLESRVWPAESTPPAVDEILAWLAATVVSEARSARAAAEA